MKNHRYLLKDDFQAEDLAEDLKVQLEVNRFDNYTITPVASRNELIVQVPDAAGDLEDTVDQFMVDYHKGKMLE
ncbi:hypothetical protein [Peribacillus deserti]|uniref:Uncharacterized protein n=1 Tax=Peribacillus deserti TaxID=673318 RepID=A0A2N5M4I5_9BACI|nr:hypothetical protein [Peribacillus deserti]PLT29245.1 hypothetical protein CUU66_13820 [Peribacillus deserti]